MARKFNTLTDVFRDALDLGFRDKEDRKKFLNLWLRTLDELGSQDKAILLFQMKLTAESRFRSKLSIYSRDYEELWFEYRNDYQTIVIEGDCERCEQKNGVLALPYLLYRERYADVDYGDDIKMDCPQCKNHNSLIVHSF